METEWAKSDYTDKMPHGTEEMAGQAGNIFRTLTQLAHLYICI